MKQEKQERQTGLNRICEKHNKEVSYAAELNDFVCPECREQRFLDKKILAAFEKLQLPPRLKECSFENYNPGNDDAKNILKQSIDYASSIAILKNGMIMVGGVGTGKTHLAVAICKKVCNYGYEARITTVPEIIRAIRKTWNGGDIDRWGNKITEEDVIKEYSSVFMLVIDEIGSQYGSDSERIIISEIVNNRYNNMFPTILIGNVTLSEAEKYLGQRVIDRVKDNGKILVFDWDSYRKPME